MSRELESRVAVVTGGAQGIGRAMADRLAECGAAAVISDLNEPGSGDLAWHHLDVSRESSIADFVSVVLERHGRPSILVNNAGILVESPVTELSTEDWDRTMAVNLRGPFLMAKHIVPHMRAEDGPTIINIGSLEGIAGNIDHCAYMASKAGLHGLTVSPAIDLGPKGIRANAIAPSWIDTAMNAGYLEGLPDPQEAQVQLNVLHPVGHTGDPGDASPMWRSGWQGPIALRYRTGHQGRRRTHVQAVPSREFRVLRTQRDRLAETAGEKTRRRGRDTRREARMSADLRFLPEVNRAIPYVDLMTPEQVHRVHTATTTLLKDKGIDFRDDESIRIWRRAGATVDGYRVRIDEDLLRHLLSSAPEAHRMAARNPDRSVALGSRKQIFTPAYGAPNVMDLDGARRSSTLADFHDFVKLAHMPPAMHMSGGVVCEPLDILVPTRHPHIVYSLIRHSDKPFMGMVTARERAEDTVAMAKILFGDDFVEHNTVMTSVVTAILPSFGTRRCSTRSRSTRHPIRRCCTRPSS